MKSKNVYAPKHPPSAEPTRIRAGELELTAQFHFLLSGLREGSAGTSVLFHTKKNGGHYWIVKIENTAPFVIPAVQRMQHPERNKAGTNL